MSNYFSVSWLFFSVFMVLWRLSCDIVGRIKHHFLWWYPLTSTLDVTFSMVRSKDFIKQRHVVKLQEMGWADSYRFSFFFLFLSWFGEHCSSGDPCPCSVPVPYVSSAAWGIAQLIPFLFLHLGGVLCSLVFSFESSAIASPSWTWI